MTLLHEKVVVKSKQVKNKLNLAKCCKESYNYKDAVSLMIMIMSKKDNDSCIPEIKKTIL
jgi:hypothetical protein